MSKTIDAVYEQGVFRPLQAIDLEDGQSVAISFEPRALTHQSAEAELRAWQKVYGGLSADEIDELESIVLDRSRTSRPECE